MNEILAQTGYTLDDVHFIVAVVPRIIHPDCRADIELIEIELRVALEGLEQDIAFGDQLSLILKMLKLASTTLFIDRAWCFRSLG